MSAVERYEIGFVLSALAEPSIVQSIDLNADSFIHSSPRLVYSTMLEMLAANEPIDSITVCDRIGKTTGKNFFGVVAEWAVEFPKSSSPKAYADNIKKNFEIEKGREIASRLLETIYSNPNAISEAIREMVELSSPETRFDHNTKSVMLAAIHDMENPKNGLQTGLDDLDKYLGGFHAGDLIILGARPAMGKTALMLNMALGALKAGSTVGIFSGEQGHAQIGQRMASMQSGVGMEKMRNNSMDEDEIKRFAMGCHAIAAMKPFCLYDKPAPTLTDIIRKARQWHYSTGCSAIFIDYIQRISVDAKIPKHEAVGAVARGLKELARDLNIPVICLAQVGRQVESRPDKRPHMGDLKDSGDIEQEADQVLMLYRDEVYNDDSDRKGEAELLIEKNRHGRTGLIRLAFNGSCLRFNNLARGY
jgi:replicative DNA helicase